MQLPTLTGALSSSQLYQLRRHCRRLSVLLVSKRWHAAALACPDLWATMEFLLSLEPAGLERMQQFVAWLMPRARHVRCLHLSSMGSAILLAEEEADIRRQVCEGSFSPWHAFPAV